ncbi:MAG: NAD(P)H-hydrate dehydratase [Alphaproteobacteria bacterium]|nr:NAD(P)H-hydrate dehydratase [Alphaproteobacteria bacterium]
MAKADALAVAAGVSGPTLMEAAGRAVAMAVMRSHRRCPVAVLCGPGNNGGDGFVAARHLQAAGWPLRVGLLGTRGKLAGDAAWAAAGWQGPIEALSTTLLDNRPLVVDALFGAGLSRAIDGIAGEVIDRINSERLAVVAVDVPSGLHGDSGEVLGRAPFAERTVTFFRAKPGHYSVAGLERCGVLSVADIGTPNRVLDRIGARAWLNEPRLWRRHLLREAVDDYKYARGHLTILGGATATGAARMAALAARRAGAGLVTITTPRSAMPIYQTADPGNLVTESDDAAAFAALLEDQRRNAVLVGPGSGIDERTRQAVLAALGARRAVVLDADAITVFASAPAGLFQAIRSPTLLTPHEGEFRRLFPDLATVAGKLERTRAAARLSGATVLLKGPDTVVAAPDGRAVINVHASPALATAGSGDVLAGIAGGLIAQGIAPLAAGAAAAWLHGESALRFGQPGLVAEDLIGGLPGALQAAIRVN